MNHVRSFFGILAGALALAGCGATGEAAPAEHGAAAGHPHAAEHVHPAAAAPAEPGALGGLGGHSIYHLESEWWNQHGEVLPLESLAGRVQVISMVYTHCAHTCPRILSEMKRIEGQLGDPSRLGFVLVSIDPERDTPDRLRDFAASTRLDPDAWALLSGSDDAILELATLLGIKYRAEGGGDYSHSNVLLVLDPAGEVVHRQLGLGEDHEPMLAAIRAALPRTAPPTRG